MPLVIHPSPIPVYGYTLRMHRPGSQLQQSLGPRYLWCPQTPVMALSPILPTWPSPAPGLTLREMSRSR